MADIPPYPLYNRTYHVYRVSPLHHGETPLLREQSLRVHAKHLRDQLKGDNVRGVEVDFAATEGALPNLGPLEECNWDLIGDEDAWIDRHRQLVDPDASQLSGITPQQARGLEITLDYDNHSYNALLLRDPDNTSSPDGFTSLPLLLLKMPAPIREIFLNYLRTSFDAHVAPLRLQSPFLSATLETYFTRLTASSSTQSIRDVIRQLQLTLTFPSNSNLLKNIEVTIASADVPGFINRGKLIRQAKQKPFSAAFSSYLQKHLALDMSHPKVQLSRITCSSFTLSTDRLKIAAPDILSDVSISQDSGGPEASASQLAVQDFYTSLVKEATGTGKFLPESLQDERRSSTPSSSGSTARLGGRRKRAVSNAATGTSKPKRSKPRGKENGSRVDGDTEMAGG